MTPRYPLADDPHESLAARLGGGRRWIAGSAILAVSAHAALGVTLHGWSPTRTEPLAPPSIVDIDLTPPPLPAPPPEPVRAAPPPAPMRSAPATPRLNRAPAVVTAAAKPGEGLDLTGGFATGSATEYVGGMTSATAPAATAPAAPLPSVPSPPRPVVLAPAADRSRRPSSVGGFEWSCPFPGEADAEHVDRGSATIRVVIDATGRVANATIVTDSGHGFGREARQCAYGKTWVSGRDRDGTPAAATVTVRVHFER